ncbi:progesterone-induced-blocking factor 1-like [Tubulanus polymorphus]|uniref:progesterone-induced-blocking factor 1-like n=1 Tax=Tubulanus polymorphus TaxID=672921 RepID=UPI003DA5581C
MAEGGEITKTFTEFETEGDLTGLETSEPITDFTLSPDETSDPGARRRDRKSRITKQLLEKKQLSHDLQLLKIELSQKTLVIDNMKAEHMQKMEELEEQLADVVHQKQILQARLEAQLKITQDESKHRQDQIRREMESIMDRQRSLEDANEKLSERAGNVRRTLRGDLMIAESEYDELKLQDETEISLKQFVSMKIFEKVNPLKTLSETIKNHCDLLADDLKKTTDDLDTCHQNLHQERKLYSELQTEHQKLTLELADTKSQVQYGDFRIENYDQVKQDRDTYEQDLVTLKQNHAFLDASYQTAVKERDEQYKEITSLKHSLAMITQDKDYLSKQVNELQNRVMYGDDRIQTLTSEIDLAKKAREEMYERYVSSREQYKSEYEIKLQEELNTIRVRTENEIDRLKTSTREMYERENRNLREARDLATSEKDRAQMSEKEASNKYEQLMSDFRQLQISGDNKLSEVQNDLKIKSFELERTQMVYEETVKHLKECQIENEKLQKKTEALTKEYYALQTTTERKITDLESQLSEKSSKLDTYEKLEQELDDVVMQSAEIENEQEAERVLFSYGYGANVPSTTKRRLKQSVQLARRVLQLERANSSLQKEIDREKAKVQQLAEELKNTNNILDNAQQPYNYLIDSIRLRDQQMKTQKDQIHTMTEDIERLEKDKSELTKMRNTMAADLERLLNQKQEMAVMKQVVLNMSQQQLSGSSPHSKSTTPRSARSTKKHTTFQDENVHKPGATLFTNQENPKWFEKLKQGRGATTGKYSSAYGISHS